LFRSKEGGAVPAFLLKKPEFTEKDLEGKDDAEIEMMKMMGFGGFDTTKVTIFSLSFVFDTM
jgi:hypothetical protein